MGNIEHEVYVCPVHGETRRVVHGTVPFCVDGDCARDVEVLKYVHPNTHQGALEDAEALAHAVSASLAHGERSPLADALTAYLETHPWSDL